MKALRFAPTVAPYALGLVMFVFGLNGFLHFLPQPPPPDRAAAFAGALAATGYMFPLIKGVEVVAGTLLLANRYVPLSLALLAPNVVNILLFHTFLAPAGTGMGVVILAVELYLAWAYRDAYRAMLAARVEPATSAAHESASRRAAAA